MVTQVQTKKIDITSWVIHTAVTLQRPPCLIIITIAGIGGPGGLHGIEGGYGGDGGLAVKAQLNNPCGLFVTDEEEVFFCDSNNRRVRKIDKNGIITTVAGNGIPGYNGDGILATNTVDLSNKCFCSQQ